MTHSLGIATLHPTYELNYEQADIAGKNEMRVAQDVIAELVAVEPRFIDYLRKDVDSWLRGTGEISVCAIFRSLTDFVLADVVEEHQYDYKNIFALVETYIAGDERHLGDAAATCFIENLLNVSDRVDPILWVPYAGEKTRKFAIAWDEFTGVKTKPLY